MDTFRDEWAQLLTVAYATVGQVAGDALYARWSDAGYIPDTANYAGLSDTMAATLAPALANKAESIAKETHSRLSDALAAALVAGALVTPHDAMQTLYDRMTGADDSDVGSRADGIGDTEGRGAWWTGGEDAALTATDSYGVEAVKIWHAVMDAKTRPEHADADGQTVVVGENFDVGGTPMMYPGDPSADISLTAGCRCDVDWEVQPAGNSEE
ncbi:MAG: hypothetical protein ACXWP0_01415 [Ktedonobacterales bacterium]